ncbi:hypothetical protein NAT51_05470 [Flavobacterium amniphilum]|uniref:hypothetical protein n=1 Tax=Flavobacterium amniphilum TaxID=1834035 RepID=UPI00202A409A|nr:hypothetical protein [Flavobacterium amniphilum]MCL9804956.1 hypothetical protein [Flavobacterium amniphilum]
MALSETSLNNFEFRKFPEKTDFTFKANQYTVEFTEPEEIRMSLYIRTVKVLKNNVVIKSFTTSDPSYFSVTSNDNKFLALPTRNGVEITNLENGNTAEFNIGFLIGNEFDHTNQYCVINGHTETKLIDLETLEVKYEFSDNGHYLTQARFGFGNKLLLIDAYEGYYRLKLLDPGTLLFSYSLLEKPFDFFKIPLEKYAGLIKSKTHCVWLESGGGMWHSSFLNQWEYIPKQNHIQNTFTCFRCFIQYKLQS